LIHRRRTHGISHARSARRHPPSDARARSMGVLPPLIASS
jgi:hypothetical protein